MNIFCISDTHGFHEQIKIPNDIDMIIHAGDASNSKEAWKNEIEMRVFLTWYNNLNIEHKIYVPGNHDTSIEQGMIYFTEYPSIALLNHNFITIEGIKLYGSPYTPIFCNWAFNVKYEQLLWYWKGIPFDTDILITHGPPLNIMDAFVDNNNGVSNVGDKYLFDKVYEIDPAYHIFGHIHDNSSIKNNGIRFIRDRTCTFINASMVKDNEFEKGIINEGITIKI